MYWTLLAHLVTKDQWCSVVEPVLGSACIDGEAGESWRMHGWLGSSPVLLFPQSLWAAVCILTCLGGIDEDKKVGCVYSIAFETLAPSP